MEKIRNMIEENTFNAGNQRYEYENEWIPGEKDFMKVISKKKQEVQNLLLQEYYITKDDALKISNASSVDDVYEFRRRRAVNNMPRLKSSLSGWELNEGELEDAIRNSD